jgi:hypothetical protein
MTSEAARAMRVREVVVVVSTWFNGDPQMNSEVRVGRAAIQ